MKKERLAELRELCEKATPGPWEAQIPAMTGEFPKAKVKPLKIEGKLYNHPMIKTPDAEFIAEARTALPEALTEIERLTAHNQVLGAEVNFFEKRYNEVLEVVQSQSQDLNKVSTENDMLKAEIERLRETLKKIASRNDNEFEMQDIARQALGEE